MRFLQLDKSERRLTFYSEGKNYWPHLKGLVTQVLSDSDVPVCYISSNIDDPGLLLKHKNYQSFEIGEGFIRNWLFENIETNVMVMTMPDLHQFQVKRSKHKVHYVYLQHSLVSLHMVYRKGAFDHYDTVFCAGPHHIKEIRALEKTYNLPAKNIVKHGYARIESIIKEANKRSMKIEPNDNKHILIAPSWGPECIIESGACEKIIDQLLDGDFKVTLRPHPQTIKLAKDKVDSILSSFYGNDCFIFEASVAGQESLHDSDIMISDWSGAALDYAFGLNKPVIFIDVPRKTNNPEYKEIGLDCFEAMIRDKIGVIVEPNENIVKKIQNIKPFNLSETYYFKKANEKGARALLQIIGENSE